MESVLQLSPIQTFFFLALQAWLFVIFPIIVIKKINYLTDLLESQFEQEAPEDPVM